MPSSDGYREFREGPKRQEAREYLKEVRRGSLVMNVRTGEKAVAIRKVYGHAPYLRVRRVPDSGPYKDTEIKEDWAIINIAIMRHLKRARSRGRRWNKK